MSLWLIEEDAYLATNYPSAPLATMAAHLGRSIDAIHCRARRLEIRRINMGNLRFRFCKISSFRPGHKPWNAGTAKIKAKPAQRLSLRDKIIAELVEHQERTVTQLSKATGSTKSSIQRLCGRIRDQHNCHVDRYEPVPSSPGNFQAVWKIGAGKDAPKPEGCGTPAPRGPDIYEPDPIPRPTLGAWGCVWNTTNGASGAGKEQTAP